MVKEEYQFNKVLKYKLHDLKYKFQVLKYVNPFNISGLSKLS